MPHSTDSIGDALRQEAHLLYVVTLAAGCRWPNTIRRRCCAACVRNV